jgi:hypothetical protein
MKLSSVLGLVAISTAASAVSVSYDTGYDNGSRSLTAVACSDGVNGLMTRYGWSTQNDIPRFPYIGGVPSIGGWNSAECGTCWKLTYGNKQIFVLGVDQGSGGYNIALDAMNALTNGQAVALGRVEATAEKVTVDQCGL